ncbi:hypothetical protein IWZ00DRAFT_312849 [Phyllosticta capitalensis]
MRRQLDLLFGLLALLASYCHASHALHVIIIVSISIIVLVKSAAAAVQVAAAKVSVQDALIVAGVDGGGRIGHQMVAQMSESALHGGHEMFCKAWPEEALSRGRVELCFGRGKIPVAGGGRYSTAGSGSVRESGYLAVSFAPGRAQPCVDETEGCWSECETVEDGCASGRGCFAGCVAWV